MSGIKSWLIFGFMLCAAFYCVNAAFNCGVCLDNGFSCINKTHLNFCSDDKPMEDVYSCSAGTICTDTEAVCAKETNETTSCGSSGGECSDDCKGQFHCVGTQEFSPCNNPGNGNWELISESRLSCPDQQVCSDDLLEINKICAPQAVLDFLGYHITCLKAPEVEPTVAPSENDLKIACINSNKTGKYFFESNVYDCATYIYCEVNTSTVAILMKCKTGQFYNAAQGKCVEATYCPQ